MTFFSWLRSPFIFILLWISSLLLAQPALATHIVGGEMELVHQTDDNYLLILNLYFDAYNGSPNALDPDLTASIFQKSNNSRKMNVVLPLVSNSFVNYTNPACAVPTLSTRKLVYSKLIQLPAGNFGHSQGYYVAVERCCRNNNISNIMAPGAAGQAFYLEFPAVVHNGQPFIDSTPRIFPPLADYACRNELFYYDFGGVDADGDSLVYDLVTPLNGHSDSDLPKPPSALPAPYSLINWARGLSTTNQIPGSPALQINAQTGLLTVRPINVGLFVFGVRCAEYRDGDKIGESRRDFQMQVLNCAINQSPSVVLQPSPTSPVPYRPGRDTLHFFPGSNRCVQLRFTDPDQDSRLTLSIKAINFTGLLPSFTTSTVGTVHGAGMPDTLTATLCFPDCMDTHGKVYLLDVVVGDNGCSLPRRDTVRVAFTAVPPPNSPPSISTTAGPTLPLHAQVGDLVTFDIIGSDPDGDALTLEMTGRGFSPISLGATLTQVSVGNQRRGRFSWLVDCRAVDSDIHEFIFTSATQPCGGREAVSISVPVQVIYHNTAPVLTTTLPEPSAPGEIAVVKRLLNDSYSATLSGFDIDFDGLTLTAGAENFNLADAGMRFEAHNGVGQASGTFYWDAACSGVNLHQDLTVTFQLVDATCRPLPQSRKVRFEALNPDNSTLKLYNIITPNADGLNDEFRLPDLPQNFCDARFASLQVFSRWGQQVFETEDRDFQWGSTGSAGVYFYLVTYTDGRRFKGWLEIVK